jgi:cell wall-associated NlpC family hydrolase
VSFAVPRRLIAASSVLAAIVATATPAVAAGSGGSGTTAAVAAAQQKVDALSIQADRAVEAYDQAQIALTTLTAQATAARNAEAVQQAKVDAARIGVQAFAVARYKGNAASPALAAFLADDPQTLMRQGEMLQQIGNYESSALTNVVNADHEFEVAQTTAIQAAQAQQAASAQLATAKAAVDKALGQQQGVLGTLTTQAAQQQAAEQAAVAAKNAAVARQLIASRASARKALLATQAAKAAQAQLRAATVAAPIAAAPALAPASSHAGAALAFAFSQLGKPYRFGGAGPGSFDCSGLTMRAYAAAGISLAHSAAAQQREGVKVPLSALQPGDLVFWGRPAYHVGIYVGGGKVLDAPHTGTDVQVQAIWGSPSGAVRP